MAAEPKVPIDSRVVFIGGDDSMSRGDALSRLLEAAGGDDAEPESITSDAKPPVEWFGSVSTVPFFSDRRVMVVRSIGRRDPTKEWDESIGKSHPAVALMAGLPETALLVLVHDDEIGDEDRQARVKRAATAWSKLVTLAGGKTTVFDVDLAKTPGLVKARAAEAGKKITPRALTLLCEMVGGKPSLAVAELDKVALYIGDEPEIRESDVKAAVMPDAEYNVFKLADAIVAGDPRSAVAQLRTLFGQTPKVVDYIFPRVFPTLLGQFRLAWQARFCLDEGTNPVQPHEPVAAWVSAKKLSSEPDWKQRKAVNAAKRLSLPKLGDCLRLLVEAEAELKGQKASLSATESLERMALEMCRVCGAR